ncbi:hypothetical protein [Streptomyces mirabilis]|uniref:hypothetical protein n=1 Tax=Streptomyces mirabilis TaxID=68239 RepID=UPI00369F9221
MRRSPPELATVTQHSNTYMEHSEHKPCPACGSNGWLMGTTHIDETDKSVVVFAPYIFVCSACDLDLENEAGGRTPSTARGGA